MAAEKKIVLLIILIFFWVQGFAQNDSVFSSKSLSSYILYNAGTDKTIQLPGRDEEKPFSLFIFLSPECPLSQDYLPLLNGLNKKYAKEISFYGIIPGKAYSAGTIKEFSYKYNVQYPLLIDSSQKLTQYLYASITPEVILLSNKGVLIYKGAIDDLLMSLGKRRVKITSEFLKNAIAESLANKPVTLKRTKAVGCKINDY